MERWRSLLPGLVLLALVACGGATTGSNQTLADPTATTARSPAAPTAPGPVQSSTPATPPPSASAAASVAAPPAAAAPSAARTPTPAATAVPQPAGTIPNGWQVYRGSPIFPFLIAYPPDWTVDDSLLPEQRVVFFISPKGRDDDERIDIEIGQTHTGANIDVQRDVYFREKSDFCEKKGIEYTEHRQIAGVAFAILGATCDASNNLTFMQVASGLKYGDEWNIQMRTQYANKEARLRGVFDPMLASLTIYAKAP